MEDKPARRRSPWKRLVLWGVPTLFVVAVTVYFFQLHQARSAWEEEVQRIKNRGEPTNISELTVKLNSPDEDAAPLLLEAIHALQEPGQAYLQMMTADPPLRVGAHRLLEDELQANQQSLELVALAVGQPHCRLLVNESIDYQRHSDLLQCRALGDLLRARVLWALGTGNKQVALTSLAQGFQLARLVGEESLTASRLTAIAIQNQNLNSLSELLANAELEPVEFSDIDDQLHRAEQACRCQPTLIAIRADLIDGTALPLIRNSFRKPGAPAWVTSCQQMLYEPQVIENAVYWIEMLSELVAISDQPGLENPEISDWRRRIEHSSFSLVKPNLMSLPFLRQPILTMRQQLILARWALRVDRYYRQNGKFPESLSQVCDAEMSVVKPDLLIGKPLVFETYERGFVIQIEPEDPSAQEFLKNRRFEVTYPRAADLQDAPDVSTQE